MKMFRKVLIANRGEIALRVMRTCREMGISTVAVYSDADLHAPHVRFADEAVHIGGPASAESYLHGERIVEAAVAIGADAIHPGYGFLSENEGFAVRCAQAGIVFIGPSPASIRQMGAKIAAKQLMREHRVPVVPGYDGEDQSTGVLSEKAQEIGFPVLIKASAGGGGKGMRIVRQARDLEESIEAARREARSSFGDPTLLLERYIDRPRHVEFQILGDQHGKLLHFFERECSIQRRHQKILEESPSPGLTPELRARMGEAAVAAGKAIGYHNAGTVEFIVAPDGEFYFLEVNTRLQVEHPVTECVTGFDLVRLQIEVAEGLPLAFAQEDVRQNGHAVEARIYAEDPGNSFLPSTGRLLDWHIPPRPGLRVDAGVETGSEVGIYYDPMLAKVIAWGPSRAEATRKLWAGLREASIQGVITNRDFLTRILEHPEYLSGEIHTHFIDEHFEDDARGIPESGDRDRVAAVVATLYGHLERRAANSLLPHLPSGYRNNRFRDPSVKLQIGEDSYELTYRLIGPERYRVVTGFAFMEVLVVDFAPGRVRLAINGVQREFRVVGEGETLYVHGALGSTRVTRLPRFPEVIGVEDAGSANAPMPGKILRLRVEVGQRVSAGDALVTLEAMKMEHTLTAPVDGIVESVFVAVGDVVEAGARLVHVVGLEAGT